MDNLKEEERRKKRNKFNKIKKTILKMEGL